MQFLILHFPICIFAFCNYNLAKTEDSERMEGAKESLILPLNIILHSPYFAFLNFAFFKLHFIQTIQIDQESGTAGDHEGFVCNSREDNQRAIER